MNAHDSIFADADDGIQGPRGAVDGENESTGDKTVEPSVDARLVYETDLLLGIPVPPVPLDNENPPLSPPQQSNTPVVTMHDVAWYRDNNAARNDISLPIVEHEWYFKSPSGDIWHGSNATREISRLDMKKVVWEDMPLCLLL
jgi:hypothetical protein